MKRIDLLGVPVDCVTMEEVVQWADSVVGGSHAHSVIAVNPEKIMKARRDPVLLRQLQSASLLIPDGIGVVFGMRFLGVGRAGRVAGADLMPRLCQLASDRGYKVFLFGASPDVNKQATTMLRIQYPALNIVGSRDGYVKEAAMPELISEINRSAADFLFIALGSPKQELWMTRYLPDLAVKVCQGVGGTFDVIAGRVKRAPWVLRRLHLEWLYRLISEPRRLMRQTALPLFVVRLALKKLSF